MGCVSAHLRARGIKVMGKVGKFMVDTPLAQCNIEGVSVNYTQLISRKLVHEKNYYILLNSCYYLAGSGNLCGVYGR